MGNLLDAPSGAQQLQGGVDPGPSRTSGGPVTDLCDAVHAGIAAFRDHPVMIAWAMKEIGFTPDILEDLWLEDFPAAEVLRLQDAGHYLQEDAHEFIVPAMLDFLRRT